MTSKKDEHATASEDAGERIHVADEPREQKGGASAPAGKGQSQAQVTPAATSDVVLTDDNRVAFQDATIDGGGEFRVFANGQFYELVGEHNGKKLYAPSH